jgi:hypothetical protein
VTSCCARRAGGVHARAPTAVAAILLTEAGTRTDWAPHAEGVAARPAVWSRCSEPAELAITPTD